MVKIQKKKERMRKRKAKKSAEQAERQDLAEQVMALDRSDPDFEKKVVKLYEGQELRAGEMQEHDIKVLESLRKRAEAPSMKTQVRVERMTAGDDVGAVAREV